MKEGVAMKLLISVNQAVETSLGKVEIYEHEWISSTRTKLCLHDAYAH